MTHFSPNIYFIQNSFWIKWFFSYTLFFDEIYFTHTFFLYFLSTQKGGLKYVILEPESQGSRLANGGWNLIIKRRLAYVPASF